MRRIIFGTGSLILGLAILTWGTAPALAEHHHVVVVAPHGSVHYGHVEPVHVVHAAPAGGVHFEHYVGPPHGGYRNPYRADYYRHFRPGYRAIVLGDAQYYCYDALPAGWQQVVLNGVLYYLLDGVYYQPYVYGGRTVYLVVPAPY